MVKFLIIVIILAAAVGGLWYTGWLTKLTAMVGLTQAPAQQMATTTPQTNEQPVAKNDLPTSQSDASDAALAQDAAAIDVQMQAMASDSTDTSAGLNDKPVTQEY